MTKSTHDDLVAALHSALLELRIELSISTRRVAAATGLRDSDLDVLDVLHRYGAQPPSVLARRMGIHPATMTSVLTRLERANWILRSPDPADRRSINIEIEPGQVDRLNTIYADATARIAAVGAALSPDTGRTVLEYLTRVGEVVREASAELIAREGSPNAALAVPDRSDT